MKSHKQASYENAMKVREDCPFISNDKDVIIKQNEYIIELLEKLTGENDE